jgi:magnesium transporter
MKKRIRNYAKKVGLPPESLVYTGNRKPSPADIELLIYDADHCDRIRTDSISELSKIIKKDKVNLLIINNLTDVTLIEEIGKFFGIQPMILEDVLNTSHLPKAEESGDQLLLTLKILDFPENGDLCQQHVSVILGEYYVIVFKDFDNVLFQDLKNRIMSGKSRARQKSGDYLFYLLMDTLVDSYYNIVDVLNSRIDKLEERLLENPVPNYIRDIYHIKQSMSEMRGVIYPVRESVLNVVQGDYALLKEDTLVYLRDVKDHINHIIHMFESGRDTLSDLIELNSSNINNRLNSSMNILTIITTLFIPLTLIAGIYGMNFRFMPELEWKAGYPFAGLLMLITAGIMVIIMKRKKLL